MDLYTIYEERSMEDKPLNLEDVDSSLHHMEKLLNNLAKKAEILPEVDQKGRSECPFAERLYAAKDNAENEVTEQLEKLKKYPDALDKEISGCERNLNLIQADSSHLRLKEARKNYSHAEGSLEAHYKKAVRLKKMMLDLITRAKKDLRKTKAKKCPPGTPKGNSYAPSSAFGATKDLSNPGSFELAPASPSSLNGPLNKEIDSLMALGPLGRPASGQGFS